MFDNFQVAERTRNQLYLTVPWVRIPPLPPMQKAHPRVRLLHWRKRCPRTHLCEAKLGSVLSQSRLGARSQEARRKNLAQGEYPTAHQSVCLLRWQKRCFEKSCARRTRRGEFARQISAPFSAVYHERESDRIPIQNALCGFILAPIWIVQININGNRFIGSRFHFLFY